MIIGHYKRTPVAYAPEMICEVINKYTDNHAYSFGFNSHLKLTSDTEIVHSHNLIFDGFSRQLIQYHSEPFRCDWKVDIPRLVIAQWPAIFDEFRNSHLVRNPVDLYSDVYSPKYVSKKIIIGYSPSTENQNTRWHDKGFSETVAILNRIKNKYKPNVDVDVITSVSLQECLDRKSKTNIFIDEVKTGSYHRSGLESLGMGVATFCYLNDVTQQMFLESSCATDVPFINVGINMLENKLCNLIENGIGYINEQGFRSRKWMEKYWCPEVIANEYISIYKSNFSWQMK